MTTLKSSVRIAGQVISNNDPQMVIALDPHAGVQISSIQDDSITYEFKGGVTQEALYNLNLTFTYQGRYQVKVPCTFKHTVVQVDYEVRPVETTVKVWDNGNTLPFQVWSGGEDITSQLTEVKRGADPTGKMLDYSLAPDTPTELRTNWWLTDTAAAAEHTLTVPYTFKLPVSVDPAQQVRTTNGVFTVSAYDGVEIRTEYKDDVPFLVETGTSKNINIDVWYKGYFAPAKAVSFLAASSDVRPFTVGGTGGPDPKRFQIGLSAGNNPGTSTMKIVLGTSLTNQVEGKNISTVNVESKIYRKGLVILKSPAPITGETGTDHETTVDFEYNGLPIDANELVWSNGAGDLRFVSATGDKVTWTIMKANNGSANLVVDTAISVKKGAEAPQTYVQKVNITPKALTVEFTTTDADLVGAESNLIGIKVLDGAGLPVSGMTAKTLTVTSKPNSPNVSPGYSKVLTAGSSAGTYNISVNLGHVAGEITINLTLDKDGVETVVPAKVYTTPGTAMNAVLDAVDALDTDETVNAVVTFTQDLFGTPAALVEGSVKGFTITGEGSTTNTSDIPLVAGKVTIPVTLSGNIGNVVLQGSVVDSTGANARPFSVNFDVVANTVTITRVGDGILIPIKPNIVQYDLTDKRGDKVSGAVKSGQLGWKGTKPGVITGDTSRMDPVSGTPGRYMSGVSAGFVEGDISFKPTVTWKGKNFPLTVTSWHVPPTPMTAVITPSSIGSGENATVELQFIQKRNGSAVSDGEDYVLPEVSITSQVAANGTLVTQFIPKVGNPGTFVGVVIGTDIANPITLTFNFDETYFSNTIPWTQVNAEVSVTRTVVSTLVTNNGSGVMSGKTGVEKVVAATLTQDGSVIPNTDSNLVWEVIPAGYLTFVSADATGPKFSISREPDTEFETTDLTLRVSNAAGHAEAPLKLTAYPNKTKPVMVITGDINARQGDSGPLPISVKSGEVELYGTAKSWSTTQNPNVDINRTTGIWNIVKEEENYFTLNQKFYFSINYDGVNWAYSPVVVMNIGDPATVAPRLVNASQELRMNLWETKPVTYTVMKGEEDITTSVTEVICTNQPNIIEMFEFVKISDTSWGFKSVKSDPEAVLGTTGIVNVKVTHEGKDYVLPLNISLKTNVNPASGGIETQRFKVEAV